MTSVSNMISCFKTLPMDPIELAIIRLNHNVLDEISCEFVVGVVASRSSDKLGELEGLHKQS